MPLESLDILIMTTGIFAGKNKLTNAEGIELDLAISFLSRFVIVKTGNDRIGTNCSGKFKKPRVFIMGFPGRERRPDLNDFNSELSYNWYETHMRTVVGNEALVLDSAVRYPRLNFYGLNPGISSSNIMSGLLGERSWKLCF